MQYYLSKTDLKMFRIAIDSMKDRAVSSEHLKTKHAAHITYLGELSEMLTTMINENNTTDSKVEVTA